jgi:hypothetical protein
MIISMGYISIAGEIDTTKKVITGEFPLELWKDSCGWDAFPAGDYKLDPDKAALIKSFFNPSEMSFIIFGGSWCGDTETELPKLIDVFIQAGISSSSYRIYGVDREKKEPTGIASKFNIEKVPTLIILLGNEELGRIVEFPKMSWEDDILMMIAK